jgi:hypothetical protein
VTLAGRIPVEPLDDERMTNIERRVVAGAVDAAIRGELRAPRRMLAGAVAAAALVAAGAIGWLIHAPADAPAIAEPAPVRIDTGADRSTIDLGDARVASDPGTAFTVTRPGGGVVIAIARGKLALEVDKRGARPPLVVRAGDTDVVVIGTRFSVDYGDGSGEVDVRVTEGAVRVVHLQQETRVAAGQAWRTRAGLVASADAASRGEPGDVSRGGDAGPASGTAREAREPGDAVERPASAVAAAPASPPVRVAAGDAPAVLHSRVAAVPAGAGSAAPAPPTLRPTVPRRTGEPASRRVAVRDDPHVDLRAAIRAQRVEPALALDDAGGGAERLVARYYDIAAHRSGDEASRAFYSIAAVKYFKLGGGADALQTLDAYVRRFPGGKEYRSALWLRVRILCLDRFDDRCRAAAYTYVHEAPEEPAARIAELLTQTE